MFTIDKNTSSQSAAGNRLEGNKIHTVTFKGAEIATVGNDTKYDVVTLTFENADGSFVDTIFAPQPDGDKRKPNNFGGENPSQVEELSAKVRHYIAALNPELDKALDTGTKSLGAKTWDEFRKIIVAATQKGIGKEVQLKLLKNNNGQATLPSYLLGISKAGSLYMRTNFIGDKISFNDNEIKRINAAATAAPSNMGSFNTPTTGGSEDAGKAGNDLDFDLESL